MKLISLGAHYEAAEFIVLGSVRAIFSRNAVLDIFRTF